MSNSTNITVTLDLENETLSSQNTFEDNITTTTMLSTMVPCNSTKCQLDRLWNGTLQLQIDLGNLQNNSNYILFGLASFFILLMQSGFPLLQYGLFRSSSTIYVLLISMFNTMFTGIIYWVLGYGFAFGEGNFFLGIDQFGGHHLETVHMAHWFFHLTLNLTVVSIVTSAIGERGSFLSYVVVTFFISTFIHPFIVHWCWSPDGWLFQNDDGNYYQDYAGAGVIHLCAGMCSMIAVATAGSRAMRFDLVHKKSGHVVPVTIIGSFLLLCGYLAIAFGAQNGVKKLSMGPAIGNALSCTLLAGSFGGAISLCFHEIQSTRHYGRHGVQPGVMGSFMSFLTGAMAGMISVSASCDKYTLWAAVVVGLIGSMLSYGIHFIVTFFKGEDCMHTIGVHFGSGLWGLIAGPIFKKPDGIIYKSTEDAKEGLAWNLAAGSAIIAWSGILSILIFGILKCLKLYPIEYDLKGSDILRQGQATARTPPRIDSSYFQSFSQDNSDNRNNMMHMEYGIALNRKNEVNDRQPGHYRHRNAVTNPAFVPETATQL